MKKRMFRQWAFCGEGVIAAALCLATACGGDGKDPSLPDAGGVDGSVAIARGMLLVSSSDERGAARVGSAVSGADVLLIDAKTQRPVVGARVEAVEASEGFLVRVSRDEAGYEPEVVHVARGGRAIVPINPATPDIRSRALQVGVQVFDEDYLGEGDITAVLGFAKTQNRPSVVFVPQLPAESAVGVQRFRAYKATVPGTLLALLADGGAATNGAVIRGRGQVVGTQGIARAGVPVQGEQVQNVARTRPGLLTVAPAPKALVVTPPDATGASTLSWTVDDSMGILVGFDVGVDTTIPSKRVGKTVRSLPVSVKRGDHFACVRAVFDGADVEPKLDCVNFDAPLAPVAPNVRVRVRPLMASAPAPTRARQPVAVEVEVENTGDADVDAMDVAVVVSRDGLPQHAEGQTRLLRVDGLPAKGRAKRVATVIPERDGAMYIAALVDPQASLSEANAQDNLGLMPLQVEPVGRNRAPVLSVSATNAGAAVKKGRPVALGATAYDPEEGDISGRIVWTSSLDKYLGQGGNVSLLALSRGKHRVRATVRDEGMVMAPAPLDNERMPGKGRGFGLLWPLRQAPVWAAEMETPEQVVGEFEIEVVDEALPVNSAPSISAGSDLTTSVGVAAVPLATASDADADPLTITWQAFLDATAVAMQDASTLSPKLIAAAPGVYRLVMEASDGKDVSKDEVVVTVVANNDAPTVQVSLPPTSTAGVPVVATVVANDVNADPLTISYELQKPAQSKAVVQAEGLNMPSFIADLPGVYTLGVWADDGRGGKAKGQAEVTIVGLAMPDGGVPVDAGVPDARAMPDAPLAMNVALGASCRQSAECTSGFCVDGVCCESACLGLCKSCAMPGMQGTCTAAAVGQNPNNDCPTGSSCNDEHQCGPFLVRPGSTLVASGQVRLVGRGTSGLMADAEGSESPTACDRASGLCLLAVSVPNMSTAAQLVAVSINNPQATPLTLASNVNPYDGASGFEHGVVLASDIEGSRFAWKPGWAARQFISTGFVMECRVAPNGNVVACLMNQREDGMGFTLDVAVGPLSSGGNLPAVVGTVHADFASSSLQMRFSPDSQKVFVLGARQAAGVPSIRWWPTTGSGEGVIIEEANLGDQMEISPDSKFVVFTRLASRTQTGPSIGTLAFAATQGAPNVTNLEQQVSGFGYFANAELGYVKAVDAQSLGEIRRYTDVAAGVNVPVVDRVFQEEVRISRDGTRMAVLRETNSNEVPELWAGKTDGTEWAVVTEQPNVTIGDGDKAFSPKGSWLVWQTGVPDSLEPRTLTATRLPVLGVPLSNQVGLGVRQWDFTEADGLISVGEFVDYTVQSGLLRIYDGSTIPGTVVQSQVGDQFAIVNDKILFVINSAANVNAHGAYVLDLAQPPPMSTCDPILQMGCAGTQTCALAGAGDVAACTPVGTVALGSACAPALPCASGLQCVNNVCLRLCDVGQATCPANYPTCQVAPGNARYGACAASSASPPDAGAPL